MPEIIQRDPNYEYEEATYTNEASMQTDMRNREANGWEVVDTNVSGGGMSGGCVGCIGFIPIFIPLGGGRKTFKVIYRKSRN